MILKCPNCKSLLKAETAVFRCTNGHSFDRAKEGYVNLLISNHKKSADPGDSKRMIQAREQFLAMGHYDFLISEIDQFINGTKSNKLDGKLMMLDMGCGSGYYTRQLQLDSDAISKYGVDISKNAISIAAKNDKESNYAVGSAFRLPVVDDAVDIMLNVFAPLDLAEAKRVLKSGAHIIKVIPGAEHMREVAELVYDAFKPHHTNILKELEGHSEFAIVEHKTITQQVSMVSVEIHQLISMTPYLYKFSKEELESLQDMEVSLSFQLVLIKKV